MGKKRTKKTEQSEKKKPVKIPFNLRMDPGMHEKLVATSADTGVDQSEFVHLALGEYFTKPEVAKWIEEMKQLQQKRLELGQGPRRKKPSKR